jgi:hypothetical protein
VEILGYFTFFWLFIFSRKFRSAQVQEWRIGGAPERLGIVYEAVVSAIFGAVVPIGLLVALVGHVA